MPRLLPPSSPPSTPHLTHSPVHSPPGALSGLAFDTLEPIKVKGKAEEVPIFAPMTISANLIHALAAFQGTEERSLDELSSKASMESNKHLDVKPAPSEPTLRPAHAPPNPRSSQPSASQLTLLHFNPHFFQPTLLPTQRFTAHAPSTQRFTAHAPPTQRFTAHAPSTQRFTAHAPSTQRFTAHAPSLQPTLPQPSSSQPSSSQPTRA